MRQFKPGQLQSGSLYPITASNAVTASYAVLALSASYAISASYEINYETSSSYAETASFAQSSSYALTASYISGSISIDTGSLVTTASFNAFTSSYTTGSFTGSFKGDGSQLTGIVSSKWTGSNPISRESDVEITGSLRVQGSITGSLFGTASNATTASYFNETDPIFVAKSGSFATTGSNTFIGTQTITGSNGKLIYTGTTPGVGSNPTLAEVHGNDDFPWLHRFYNDTFSTSSAVMAYYGWNDGRFVFHNESTQSIGLQVNGYNAENGLLVYSDKVAFVNNVEVTGSLNVVGVITGSLFGTASWATNAITASYVQTAQTASYVLHAVSASFATSASRAVSSSFSTTSSYAINAATASNILGGKATHVPYFITDTTLATSSIYQSGSTSVIINQDNNTTANPEALYVWQPSTSSINVISGKGNLNNYLQLNIQNTNQGISASSDVVATANNGNETTNYIDMGINSENYNTGFIGGVNDAYLYSTGNHLHIGNVSNFPVQIFAGGSDVDIHNKLELNPNNQHTMSGSLEISGSLNVKNNLTSSGLLTNGTNTILGNTVMSGSSTIQGTTTMTGSLLITGSTTQTGNNTLLGNTTLSGSLIISGALSQPNPTISIFGDLNQTGYTRYLPVTTNIDTSISASYIFVSGSTNDLYFSQNGSGYSNVTRLRWLEGNLYTGLLNGGLITTQSSTIYRISSGSGIIVNLNASLSDNPYPTIQYLNWGNLSGSINAFTSSYQQCFVGIDSTNNIFAQGVPFSNGQFDTIINIGGVFFQNQTSINAVKTQPSVAYGFEQQQNIFNRAFGALKLSGYTLSPSGSSTGSLVVASGTAYAPGSNYTLDPNEPSYTVDNGTNISKIFRYRQSGSTWVYDTNVGAGYATINPGQYSNSGVLTTVQPNDWSIQRVFWFPNSVVKAIVVYYGNQSYSTEADAIANIQFEPFVEAPNTAANAIYLGAIVIRGNGVFTTPADFKILPGGLFRQVGGAGGGGSTVTQTLAGLSDVAISGQTNGQPLVYNSTAGKWVNQSTLIANLTGTATNATTASYISPTFISASAAASGFGSGASVDTGSLLTTASFNAYTGSNTSQFAGTASYASVASTTITAQTASYATNFTVGSTLSLDGTLFDRATVNSTIVGANNLFTQATGSFTSAFGKYTVRNATRSRAGEFWTVWNGTTVEFTDTSTADIGGPTTSITFNSTIVGSNIQVDAVATQSGWTVKMLITFI